MSFISLALIAGLSIALVAGPVGCFVVWRRMSYFGDSLAHAALLGIGTGLMLDINLQFTVLAVCLLAVPVILLITHSQHVADDTALGIVSHASLAIGLTAVSRSLFTSYIHRSAGFNTSITVSSQVPANSSIFVFRQNAGASLYSNARLSFYSIGESLDLALLDARVTTLMSDLAAAIP